MFNFKVKKRNNYDVPKLLNTSMHDQANSSEKNICVPNPNITHSHLETVLHMKLPSSEKNNLCCHGNCFK